MIKKYRSNLCSPKRQWTGWTIVILAFLTACTAPFPSNAISTSGSVPVKGNEAGIPTQTSNIKPSQTFNNPLNFSGPDPWMNYYKGNYYLAATTWGSNLSIGLTMRKAPTIEILKTVQPEKIWQDTDLMNCCNYWAPEFFLLDGSNGKHWYGYFTGGPSDCCDYQHMNVIESVGTDPLGPYIYKAKLDDGFDRWAIDTSILQMDGKSYLLFSAFSDGKLGQGTQNIYIIPMSNPWTLSGPRGLLSTPTYDWETSTGAVNEGPVALQHDGKTFVVYSANGCWGPNYSLGMLTYKGGDPLRSNSWEKSPQPVFKGTDNVFSPGHNTFFKSPDGTEDWITYHGNNSATGGCDMNRSPRIQKIQWNKDGTPNLGIPVSPTESLVIPSGE
jgi:GH43 family beta-xylosidase